MNINTLAKKISGLEGKKVQVNIAQIKEVLACANKVLKKVGIQFYTIVRNARPFRSSKNNYGNCP